jgi:hypothetical protein
MRKWDSLETGRRDLARRAPGFLPLGLEVVAVLVAPRSAPAGATSIVGTARERANKRQTPWQGRSHGTEQNHMLPHAQERDQL